MTFKTYAAAALVAAGTLAYGAAASAQARPAAAAPTISHGPPVPGVCVVDVEGAIATSTVGKYVSTRLQQIAGQAQAELTSEGAAIQNDDKALQAQRTSLDQNTMDQRVAALQVRAAAFNRKQQLRERELQVTEQKALQRVGEEMQPLMQQAYQQKNCSVLLQRTAVLAANPAMDITPQVVAALNAKITQFAFEREHLDQTAAVGAPPPTTLSNSAPAPRPTATRPAAARPARR